MRNFLAEHSGAFDPDEVHTLVAAFDKAWEAIQPAEWSTQRLRPKLCERYSRNILLRPLRMASVTMAGYATALSLLWLKRICEPQIVRRGKAASVCGLTSSRVAVRPGPSLTGFSKTAQTGGGAPIHRNRLGNEPA
jgi:hypothetical protein